MAYDELVTFGDVEALEEDGQALRVRVNGRDVWIANEHMAIADGVVAKTGDHGSLVMRRWVAIGLGLLVPNVGHIDPAVVEAWTRSTGTKQRRPSARRRRGEER